MGRLFVFLFLGILMSACSDSNYNPTEPKQSTLFYQSSSNTQLLEFYLVDADSNEIIGGPHKSGDTINVYGTSKFSIMVETSIDASHVEFFQADEKIQRESQKPYASCGDLKGDYVDCRAQWQTSEGSVVLSAQAFSGRNIVSGRESVVLDYDKEIIIVEEPTVDPAPADPVEDEPTNSSSSMVDFNLINTSTNQVEGMTLASGDTLSINSLSNKNIKAEFRNIQYDKVRFDFSNGHVQVEGLAPYAACGDKSGQFIDCGPIVSISPNLVLKATALLKGESVGEATLNIVVGEVAQEPVVTPQPEDSPQPEPAPTPEESPVVNNPDETPSDAPPIDGEQIITANLGWKSGENVTTKLANILQNMNAGQELFISHLYRLDAANIVVPAGLTLRGAKDAGFNFVNVAESKGQYLKFQSNTRLINLTLTDDNRDASEELVRTNNKIAMVANGENLQIINSLFYLSSKIHIRLSVNGLLIKGTHFKKGYYQLNIGVSQGIRIEDSLFSDSYGDGIKTIRAGGNGAADFSIVRTVFERNQRDGIDTTGGFRNSVVDSCIFRDNGMSGLDLKNIYELEKDIAPGNRGNDNILIKNTEFIDNNGIVFTTLDRLDPQFITDSNHKSYLPHNIHIEDSIFDTSTSFSRRAFHFKDAYDVFWTNVKLLGKTQEARIYGLKDDSNYNRVRPNLTKTNYNLVGTNVTTGPSRGRNTTYPFTQIGPR